MKFIYYSLGGVKQKIAGSLLLLTLSVSAARAQTITSDVVWDFSTANASSITPANANVTVSTITQGNNNGTTTLLTTTSPSSGYAGASGTNNAGAAARVGALNTAAAGSAYFEVTFTPAGGVIINSISFGSRSTGTGPQAYSIRTNINGYATDAATGTLSSSSSWALNTATLIGAAANAPITLRIYGYGGVGNPSAGTANWRIDDVTINVSASATPLPVNLASFGAFRKQQEVVLQWSTAAEKNVNYFGIERSTDGEHFSAIGSVNARNQSNGADYTYTDLSASGAAAYYRLRTVDFDGQSEYSRIVSVKNNAALSGVSLEANLVRNTLPVSFPDKTVAELYIVNLAGAILQRQAVNNMTTLNWDISSLPAGMYLLQVKGISRETLKFIKQ